SSGTSGTIRELAISRSNPNVIYATSGGQIYRSSNGGVNFVGVFSGLPTNIITSVAVHPDSEDVVLVTYSGFGTGKVYRTTNAGANWTNITGNLPDSPANDVLIYYPGFATSTYLVAMDVGVFISTDYGQTWTELADGLPNTVAISLDYNLLGNKLRVGTHGRGVYETSLVTGVIDYRNTSPESFVLYQNYPNPFNPTTHIRYALPTSSRVQLVVYDALGREVERLVDAEQSPGTYAAMWDARTRASGVYFYKLTAGGFSQTKKLLLVR
ncbi:MAG TPA: T9SS type A sorting domain-containing protein, partial [Bacteroidota bacterium]|nr:T9SS type A sorting domain-containing protein [Bacteroidota bacterium]